MRKLAPLMILLGLMALVSPAQTDNSTRPRVARRATPPVIRNNPYPSTAPDSAGFERRHEADGNAGTGQPDKDGR